jgi:hypothetical protein
MVDAGVRPTPAPRTRNDDLELLFEFDQSILPGLRCTPGGAGGDVLRPRSFRDQCGRSLFETRQGASCGRRRTEMTTFFKAEKPAKHSMAVGTSMVAAVLLSMTMVGQVAAGSATFTTFNSDVDGEEDLCLNSAVNCNVYRAKEYVWLNGGPTANALLPDGEYFFAVLDPGGQGNPNDGGEGNLSDDYDCYLNRRFTVTNGEVSGYFGYYCIDLYPFKDKHSLDDGKIRLFPYAESTTSGGVYILAVCSMGDGSSYPVRPEDCAYDAFKVMPE